MLDPKRIADQHLRTAAHLPDPGEDEVYLREQVALMDRLISKGEARRLGRTSDVEPESVTFDGDRVGARMRGVTDTYDTRITLRPRPGHHCTCVDWGKNGLRVGPCKHVLSLGYVWRENVERKLAELDFGRTARVEKTATSRHPTKLAMFDFDGTLFNSEERNPDWWTKPGQYSWGSDPRSLTPPCVPERPEGSGYWNMKVVQAAREASADPMTYVVLITGRLGVHEPRIRELLAQQGIRPDGFYFNRGGSAAAFKKRVFGTLFIRLATMQTLDIWENENQGIYGDFVHRLSQDLDHDIELEVHHVSEKHVPALCSAEDFPGEMRVAATPRGVGLFIPVPEHLAEQFPSLGKEDTSPPHVTLLYVGPVPNKRVSEFMSVVEGALAKEPGPVLASLGEPDSFVQPDKGRRVWFSQVTFSKDVATIRDRVWNALTAAGFEVQHSFPLAFVPHATLAYVDGGAANHDRWTGKVPRGSWSFDGVEVWGLTGAKKRVVPLGTYNPPTFVEVGKPSPSRIAAQSRGERTRGSGALSSRVGGANMADIVTNVASRFLNATDHRKSVALMKFLARVAKRLGVAEHVYVVGGAPRNYLINEPIKDIDMVVDSVALGAHRDAAWFAKQVTLVIPAWTDIVTDALMVSKVYIKGPWMLDGEEMEGEVVEIVNARAESYAKDEGHKPVEVTRTNIETDVYRREFTFNTLMWRLLDLTDGPEKSEVIDITGCGLRDLANREMRCPADPDTTFGDDPTRIIRTIKFAFKYGFTLPPDVKEAARRQAPKLKRIPAKAWSVLRDIVLESPEYQRALLVMVDLGVVDVLKEMVVEDKPFGTTLTNYAQSKGVAFLFSLMDLGLPLGASIQFLTPAEQTRLREITSTMERDEAWAFLGMLKSPGSAFKDDKFQPGLMAEFGIKPKEAGPFFAAVTRVSRVLLLDDPSLVQSPDVLRRETRDGLLRVLGR